MFSPKNEQTANQALKVQELSISDKDPALYSISGGSTYILIREPVDKIYLARLKDDSANVFVEYAQSSLSVVDSVSLTAVAPSNREAIKVLGLAAMAADDVLIVKYTVLEHL